jgi:hypothetical protein
VTADKNPIRITPVAIADFFNNIGQEQTCRFVQNLRYVITECSIILDRPQQPCVGGPNDFSEIAELHNAAEGGF